MDLALSDHFRSVAMESNKYYKEYIEKQKEKVFAAKHKELGGLWWEVEYHKDDKLHMVQEIGKVISLEKKKILIIGARWGSDVLAFMFGGYKREDIIAVDLHDPPLSDLVRFGDAHDLSFCDKDIDVVWIYHAFEHFLKPSLVLNEIRKYTKQQAHIVIVHPPFDSKRGAYDVYGGYDDETGFNALFCRSGFKKIYSGEYTNTKNISRYFVFQKQRIGWI